MRAEMLKHTSTMSSEARCQRMVHFYDHSSLNLHPKPKSSLSIGTKYKYSKKLKYSHSLKEDNSCSSASYTCCKAAISWMWNTEFIRILKRLKRSPSFFQCSTWDDGRSWLSTCILLQGDNASFLRSTLLCLADHKATVTSFTGKQTCYLQANASLWIGYDFSNALLSALQSFRCFLTHTGRDCLAPVPSKCLQPLAT